MLSLAAPFIARSAGAEPRVFRAAIIGHSGRGDYGHSLDVAFTGVPRIEVCAVADPDAAGRQKAKEKSQAQRDYADWREMLEREKPNLVCLASRWSEHRHEMGKAALEQGARIFSEKPFTRTLAEADDLLAIAKKENLKIAVAHQMRLSPSITDLKNALDDGLVGDLIQIHSWGKQDPRAGGEDMIVLGTHIFDLLRLFAGDARWCSASVLQDGRDITANSGRVVHEQIGPVAGTDIFAQFRHASGISSTFTSHSKLRETFGPWGIELLGSKGRIRILTEIFPAIYVLKPGKWEPSGKSDKWVRWEGDPGHKLSAQGRGLGLANRRIVDDLIESIDRNREPICSAEKATKSLEMVMAVYAAALRQGRVELPLRQREHPLQAARVNS